MENEHNTLPCFKFLVKRINFDTIHLYLFRFVAHMNLTRNIVHDYEPAGTKLRLRICRTLEVFMQF